MFRKLPAFFLLVFSGGALIYGQKTPETPKQPARESKPFVWEFLFDGGGSYLGVEATEVTRENFGKFGLSEVRGVAVGRVLENSPAAQAGLQSGDVIVKFDGEEVSSVRKLTRLISEVAPDHQAKVTILRGGNERDLTVTMGKRETPKLFDGDFKMENLPNFPNIPNMPNMPRVEVVPPGDKGDVLIWKNDGENAFFFGSNRQIGVSVSSLTKQLGDYFGVPEGKGLLITSVRENSPGAKAGLKAGDVITEADGKAVKSNADLVRALNEKKEGEVSLTIIRDKNRQALRVTPETVKGDLTPLFEGKLPPDFQFKMPVPSINPAPVAAPRVVPVPKRIL